MSVCKIMNVPYTEINWHCNRSVTVRVNDVTSLEGNLNIKHHGMGLSYGLKYCTKAHNTKQTENHKMTDFLGQRTGSVMKDPKW